MLRYAWRDLRGNPRRSLVSSVGVALGIGLFSGVLFFMDGSGATMTRRALAPLAIDMQLVVTSPAGGGLALAEHLDGPNALESGQQTTVTLTVSNEGRATAHDVVVTDVPPAPLVYVGNSTSVADAPIPDASGDSPLSHGAAGFGLNVGDIGVGARTTITYLAQAVQAVDNVASLPVGGSVSSREQVVPVAANAPHDLTLEELEASIEQIPGVAAADGLRYVDLPPGSLAAGPSRVDRPVRVFAFDQRYESHYPSIRIVDGGFRPGSALLSVESARALRSGPGATIELTIPGRATALAMPIGGAVDLSDAQPLFASRDSRKLEEFLYVPDVVVVPPDVFEDSIVPAMQDAQDSGGSQVRSFPVQELDVLVDRARLDADPGSALEQTETIAAQAGQVTSAQGYLIDNVSNALAVARGDAAAGRRMFFFLGLPGILLATFLAAYGAGILAASERRERAILRVRGAHLGHLRRIALYKATALAGIGSLVGIVLGLVAAAAILGWSTFRLADPGDLLVSGLLAAGVGAVVTSLALYVPALRSARREIGGEQRVMATPPTPAWRRSWLDLALIGTAAVLEIVAIRSGALIPIHGSVYEGVAISLPARLMPAPLLAWVGGVLLCVRLLLYLVSRAPRRSSGRFGSPVRGALSRTLRRRPSTLAAGTIGVGLVVASATGLTVFGATYDAAKSADVRFVVGGDLRITPSASHTQTHRIGYAPQLTTAGVSAVSPVTFALENAVLIGPHNQGRVNLAAIDATTFARVAPLPDEAFIDGPGGDALGALASDPRGIMVDAESADDLEVEVGDMVAVILALGTDQETQARFHVVSLFDRFPGFPEGANLVVDLGRYERETSVHDIDFFLARAVDASHEGLGRAVASLRSGPGATDPARIDTVETALGKDQSSLTAVNVNGLLRLNDVAMALMCAAVIVIFVFGLMLQRRKEYVTLRAQGMRVGEVRTLIVAEAMLVAVAGAATGLLVGVGVASLLVRILRALFVLDPVLVVPIGRISTLAALVFVAALTAGLVATGMVHRLRPTEILREE